MSDQPSQSKKEAKARGQNASADDFCLIMFRLGKHDAYLTILRSHLRDFAARLEKRWKAMDVETEKSLGGGNSSSTLKIHERFYRSAVSKLKVGIDGLIFSLSQHEDAAIICEKVKVCIHKFQKDFEAAVQFPEPLPAGMTIDEAIRVSLDNAMAAIRTMKESLAEIDADIARCREAKVGDIINYRPSSQ